MGRLAEKVAMITGAGGGIGRATAERFTQEGAKVALLEIDDPTGEAATASAQAHAKNGGEALFIHCDVTDSDAVVAAVKQTVAKFGRLDILHNNAGGSTIDDGPVTEAPEEEFWRVMKLDLYGTFLCSKHAIPEIARSGNGGSVINMSSNVALMALPGRDCYTAAKGGIASMTRSMAVEYAPDKIRVNAIAPSVTLSDRVKKLMAASPEIDKIGQQHLLGLGQPIHIADMAVYLASDESAITTGQVISVDSGVTIY